MKARARRTERPVLAIRGLRVERGRTVILAGIDWSVAPGEHWVILGANGSGKSSLLAALTGYLTPTAGRLELLGGHYGRNEWPRLRLRVGIVGAGLPRLVEPDETALDLVTAGSAALLNAWGRFPPAVRARARRLLAQVGLAACAGRRWGELSEGERQRAMIARALMPRPALLLLDEPCAGLDPAAREDFVAFLGRLARRRGGPALVLVTHHVEEIAPGFTHALILGRGTVVAAGTLASALKARHLARALGAGVTLRRAGSRWTLRVRPRRNVIV